jgi:hypothetical protein
MTVGKFNEMNEAEQRAMAQQLCEVSDQFEFDGALELVKWRPARAQELLDMRAEMKRQKKERERRLKRLRRALIEDFG